MKTPMQEHIEWLKKEWEKLDDLGIALQIGDCIEHAESMLEKEKGVMCEIYDDAIARFDPKYFGGEGEDYYNEIFKPIER